jgi:2Fe-2S ferredoxin
MPKVIYITASGSEYTVNVDSGTSAMEGALQNNVPGIDGDCGGNAACATCHVYVDAAWQAKAGTPGEGNELQMLTLTDGYVPDSSRLACQIKVTDDLDGLVLRMPTSQH